MKQLIPKEYYLEKPASYNDRSTKQLISFSVTGLGVKHIYENPEVLHNVFGNEDHYRMLVNIFQYIVDTCSYSAYEQPEEFIKHLMLALFESGFFG